MGKLTGAREAYTHWANLPWHHRAVTRSLLAAPVAFAAADFIGVPGATAGEEGIYRLVFLIALAHTHAIFRGAREHLGSSTAVAATSLLWALLLVTAATVDARCLEGGRACTAAELTASATLGAGSFIALTLATLPFLVARRAAIWAHRKLGRH